MKEYHSTRAAEQFANHVMNLYTEMEKKFGHEMAWEFVVEFYKGAGRE